MICYQVGKEKANIFSRTNLRKTIDWMLPFCTSKNNHLSFANLENYFYISLISWNYITNYNYNKSFVHSLFSNSSLIRCTTSGPQISFINCNIPTNLNFNSSIDSANQLHHSQTPKRYKEQKALLYISTNNTNWFWTIPHITCNSFPPTTSPSPLITRSIKNLWTSSIFHHLHF